jgi:dephospho-CoA kinase
MLVLGLTGSAAMGKSTVSAMLAERGVAVFDADRTVHALYQGAAVPVIDAAFAGTTRDGAVDRDLLRARVLGDEPAMQRLEALVHPLVKAEEEAFLARARDDGRRIVVLDVPLLFETGAESDVDVVLVVSAPAEVQRQRMLARPGMTPERLEAMLARQIPDAEKRRRAHYVIDTGGTFDDTRRQVKEVIRAIASIAGGR